MDIFRTPLYRLNVKLLRFIGQWPYTNHTGVIVQQILFQISIITVMMTQAIKLFEIWGDLDIMIECLTPMGVQLAACVKSLNCIINRKKMMRLLETMERDWLNIRESDEVDILKRFSEEGRTLALFYTLYMSVTICMYVTIPLMPRILDVILPLNESRQRIYLYQTQYYVDPEEYFYPILLHTYSGTVITVSTIIAVDAMYARYVHHACGMLAIIGYRLEKMSSDVSIVSSEDDSECYQELVKCIKQHFETTEFASLIETSYSTVYLITIGISIILLSISAVQLLIKIGQYEEMIRLLQFNLAQFSHLLFNSWPGQKLLDQCSSLQDSIYFAKWYTWSLRTRKLLTVIMMRAMRPQKITAGKIYIMSMENFGAVVQTSVSYFTVFASMR